MQKQNQSNKKLFEGQTFYTGIDYHKKSWKVTILGEHYEHKTMTQPPDPMVLYNYLIRNFPGGNYKAVYEAGFSGFTSCRKMRELGIDCQVVHPIDIPTSAKEREQKTDKTDSRKLSRLLRGKELNFIHIPDVKQEADRALMRQRFRFVRDLTRLKNRVKSLLFQFGTKIPDYINEAQARHWSKKYIQWLKGLEFEDPTVKDVLLNYVETAELIRPRLLKVNRQIRKLANTYYYQSNYKLLTGIPGIGVITAMTILTEIGDILRFKRLDDLCNYVGLVPKMYGSGDKMRTGKMVKRGRKELKIMLIEAAWIAVRKDPALMHKFNELSGKMKKNKAIIRIARKLLSRIRYVLTHKQEYELSVVE